MDHKACDEAQRNERTNLRWQEVQRTWQGQELHQDYRWFQMGQLASSQHPEVPQKEEVDVICFFKLIAIKSIYS